MSSPTPAASQTVSVQVAEPGAIGLFGLAMVTLVASSQKLGITTGTSLILPWAIFLGATAQLAAGVYDFKRNNIFGGTAFLAYAMFWYAVAMTWMVQLGIFGEKAAAIADPKQLGFGFLGYLIFTIYMTVGSMGTNKVLFIIFFLIDLLFIGLSSNVLMGSHFGHTLAAYSELLISIFSFYGSAAVVLNHHYNKPILNVGKPFGPYIGRYDEM